MFDLTNEDLSFYKRLNDAVVRNGGERKDLECLCKDENIVKVIAFARGEARIQEVESRRRNMDNGLNPYYLAEIRAVNRGVDDWIGLLTTDPHDFGTGVLEVVRDKNFTLSSPDTIFRPVILFGVMFDDLQRYELNILTMARVLGYVVPPPDLALYLRSKLQNEYLTMIGVSRLLVMHEPIVVPFEEARRLCLYTDLGDSAELLGSHDVHPNALLKRSYGFVFLAPKEERKGAGAEIGDGIAKAAVA